MLPGHLRVTFYTTVVAGSGSIVPIRSLREYPCQLPVYTEEKKQKLVFTRVTIFLNNKIESKFVNFEVFKLTLLIFDPFHYNHNDIITT